MKRIALFTFIALGIIALVGCSSGEKKAESTSAAGAPSTAGNVANVAKELALTKAVTAEVGCAGCIYHMEGVESCSPAIKMAGGEPMLLKGIEVDAHGLGLCEAAQTATVQGDVKDGVFIASVVNIKGSEK